MYKKILTCTNVKASKANYKTKQKIHNGNVYNFAINGGTCYVCHAGNGGVNSDVFASMTVNFLKKN